MLPTSIARTMAELDCKNRCSVSHSLGRIKLPPSSLAGIPGLVNGSPSPVVYVLFYLVILHCFTSQMSLCMSPLRACFPFPAVLYFSCMDSCWFLKPSVLGFCVSSVRSKG